ncbi:2-oxoglutarate dehydrogenase E1 [Paenibacillus periandrae]|uniref:2-oxoglutarate dehydrogenase E1 n=1 Tax=Paenibacillus periandrae TaxID=1761741 RepID=UPI001F09384B|nr:2-oxoglutarate dehydrogenase E1 [Paenibacillus periandrae]
MKAITIWQPWATLAALEEKGNETRGWATKYRGPIAIHAAKYIDGEACEREPIKSTLAKHGYTADNLPTGAIVGFANLEECWSIGEDYQSGMPILYNGEGGRTKLVNSTEAEFGWYAPDRFAWEFADVKQLPEPIPAKGQQGLWNWEVSQ